MTSEEQKRLTLDALGCASEPCGYCGAPVILRNEVLAPGTPLADVTLVYRGDEYRSPWLWAACSVSHARKMISKLCEKPSTDPRGPHARSRFGLCVGERILVGGPKP